METSIYYKRIPFHSPVCLYFDQPEDLKPLIPSYKTKDNEGYMLQQYLHP